MAWAGGGPAGPVTGGAQPLVPMGPPRLRPPVPAATCKTLPFPRRPGRRRHPAPSLRTPLPRPGTQWCCPPRARSCLSPVPDPRNRRPPAGPACVPPRPCQVPGALQPCGLRARQGAGCRGLKRHGRSQRCPASLVPQPSGWQRGEPSLGPDTLCSLWLLAMRPGAKLITLGPGAHHSCFIC